MKKKLLSLLGVSPEMIEMAEIFHMPGSARWKYIYLPAIFGKKIRGEKA